MTLTREELREASLYIAEWWRQWDALDLLRAAIDEVEWRAAGVEVGVSQDGPNVP